MFLLISFWMSWVSWELKLGVQKDLQEIWAIKFGPNSSAKILISSEENVGKSEPTKKGWCNTTGIDGD